MNAVAVQASDWLTKALSVAPTVPAWLAAGVAKVLADPKVSSDGLLALADALAEAGEVAAIERCGVEPRHLDRLADLCRRHAPARGDFW